MAIDVRTEELFPLNDPIPPLPNPLPPSTAWRWHRHGLGGIRLETVVIGRRRYTSVQAVQRWIRAITDASDQTAERTAPEESGSQRTQAVEKKLKDAGLM